MRKWYGQESGLPRDGGEREPQQQQVGQCADGWQAERTAAQLAEMHQSTMFSTCSTNLTLYWPASMADVCAELYQQAYFSLHQMQCNASNSTPVRAASTCDLLLQEPQQQQQQEEDNGEKDTVLVTDADTPTGELVVLQLILLRYVQETALQADNMCTWRCNAEQQQPSSHRLSEEQWQQLQQARWC